MEFCNPWALHPSGWLLLTYPLLTWFIRLESQGERYQNLDRSGKVRENQGKSGNFFLKS